LKIIRAPARRDRDERVARQDSDRFAGGRSPARRIARRRLRRAPGACAAAPEARNGFL